MAVRSARKLAILAKPETVYGTDIIPTAATDAILTVNATIEPLAGSDVSRDIVKPFMGHQGQILTENHVKVSFEVEVAGSGAAGTKPGLGTLLRGCAMSETVTATTKVEYKPISSAFESLSIYFIWDNNKHALLGARGNVSVSFDPKAIPRFKFDFWGLLVPAADAVNPTPVYTVFQTPVPVNDNNTLITIHGQTLGTEKFSMDVANAVEPRMIINAESIEMTDRQSTGEITLNAAKVVDYNWFAIAQAHTTGVLALTHGLVAGNIFSIDAPKVQIGRPKVGESQKIITDTLPLIFQPNAGNDEFVWTFK